MKNNIDKILKERKISVVELAKRLNTSEVQIHRLKSGQRKLTLEWLGRLAKGLDCRPFELVSENIFHERATTYNKPSTIDPKRLRLAQKAVEEVIKEKQLVLTNDEVANFLAEVYNQTLKLELQGKTSSPAVMAELLIKKVN